MARGWESKSVEAQIEEGERAAESDRKQQQHVSAEIQNQLESLRLARARTEDQLSRAKHAAHREMLMKALMAIESQAEALNDAAKQEHDR